MRKIFVLLVFVLVGWIIYLSFIQNTESSANIRDQSKSKFAGLSGPYLGQKPPGNKAELFAPGLLSAGDIELSIAFTPDGKEFSYSIITAGASRKWVMMYSRIEKGLWTDPKEFSFNPNHAKGYPFYSPDGKRLYFYSYRNKTNPPNSVSSNIWYVESENGDWSNPTQIDFEGDFKFRRTRVFITAAANGNLYFPQWIDGNGNIYVSRYENGKYLCPERVSNAINDPGGHHPYIAPDENYMIFDDDRSENNYGASDLFISFRDKSGKWMKAQNLGERVNTLRDERRPFVSFDGKYLFFASDKGNPDGHWRLYWIDAGVIEELRPK
jgi:Tol biopolymer transport system component